jgi:hypothetical protein
MMSLQFDLGKHRTVSNSGMFTNTVGIYPDNIPFDIQLRVDPHRDGFSFLMFGPSVTVSDVQGVSMRSAKELFLLVEECRKAWADRIVDLTRAVTKATGGMRNELPFQDNWDLAKEPALLEQAAPHLALAGNRLFELIFEAKSDADLKELARILRQLLAEKPRYIAVTSDKFFLPWGMLYTHPVDGEKLTSDGSNWKKEGFWGYRHIVQHNPRKSRTDPRIESKGGAVPLSVNVNEKISSELTLTDIARAFINGHLELIAELGGKPCVRRTKKKELEQIFSEQRDMLERILYFYCHGHGSSADSVPELGASKLILTDDPVDPVSAADFQVWAKDSPLTTQPLIFINACQGGHMTTMFYQTLAFELLDQGAVGVVGAQVDIPAIFAAAYGKWLFERFFKKSNGRVRLGPLLREANQHFWDKHHNPLGLVYSLYRGVDCFIDWQDA